MKRGPCRFTLSSDADVDDTLATLQRHVALYADVVSAHLRRYFDSFDGLLYAQGTVLYQERVGTEQQLRWERLADGSLLHTLTTTDVPRFATDLPPGPFQDELAAILTPRAIVPL